jgi:HSP20 family molecular chaperone IbpA
MNENRAWASAAVDVFEGKDEYLVFADIPGVKKDDVTIQYHDGELRLEATRVVQQDEDWPADFRRVFAVDPDVDVERISAEIDRGVLRVHLPKKELAKPRQIPIKVG